MPSKFVRLLEPTLGLKPSVADLTRFQIMDTALKIITEEGLENLFLSTIASRSGFSKARILYHYRNVDLILLELYQLVLRYGQHLTLQRLQNAYTLEAKLESMIDAMFEWLTNDPRFGAFFVLMWHKAAVSKKFREIHSVFISAATQRIRGFLLESGKFKEESEVEQVATQIHSIMSGVGIKFVAQRERLLEEAKLGLLKGVMRLVNI